MLSELKQRNRLDVQPKYSYSNKIERPKEQQFSIPQNTTLTNLHEERSKRVQGLSLLFIGAIEELSKSDCFRELSTNDNKVLIPAHFPHLRRVRGDGNCMYSSIGVQVIEMLHASGQLGCLLSLVDELKFEIVWNKAQLLSRQIAVTMTKNMINKVQELNSPIGSTLIDAVNTIHGIYDLIVILMRSIAIHSLEINHNKEPYVNYIHDVDELQEKIATYEEEGDYITLQLIAEVLPIRLELINFSDQKAFESRLKIISYSGLAIVAPTIYLKYQPGHYEILYSKLYQITDSNQKLNLDALY